MACDLRQHGIGIVELKIDGLARVEQRGADGDIVAEERLHREGIETALKLSSAIEADVAARRSSSLIVPHEGALAVARDVEPVDLQLDDPEAVLTEITGYLRAARTSLAGGAALPGPDTGGDYDDLAFALPANAGATYCKRKMPAATERLGKVAQVWEAE